MFPYRKIVRITIPLTAIGLSCWMMSLGLAFSFVGGARYLLCPVGFILGMAVRPSGNLRQDRLIESVEALAIFATICLLGAIACFPAAAMSHGFVDAQLAAADRTFGFNWTAYRELEIRHPSLRIAWNIGYSSIFVTPSILLVALVMDGRVARAYRFMLVYALALAISVAIFIVMPAAGADIFHLGLHAPGVSEGSRRQMAMIEAMQSGRIRVVALGAVIGPISFPSFHMVSAVLFMWATWPMPRLRQVFVGINLLMIAATPVHGGHYMIDLVGGTVVAIISLWIVRACEMLSAPYVTRTIETLPELQI